MASKKAITDADREQALWEEPRWHTDYHGRDLFVGDTVTHFFDNKAYKITKMLRTNDALVEPLSGMTRSAFSKCPCECLIRRMENVCVQEKEEACNA